MIPTRIGASRAARAALTLAMVFAAGAAAAQSSVTVRTSPQPQDRGIPPTFQEYPLWDRITGPGGAIFPGYTTPVERHRDNSFALLTGGGSGRMAFAAGTADSYCQDGQVPQILVLDAPVGVRLSTDIGQFQVQRNDAGSTYCLGRVIQGARLFTQGRVPPGATATLQVVYPQVGRSGRTITHVVALPASR